MKTISYFGGVCSRKRVPVKYTLEELLLNTVTKEPEGGCWTPKKYIKTTFVPACLQKEYGVNHNISDLRKILCKVYLPEIYPELVIVYAACGNLRCVNPEHATVNKKAIERNKNNG